MAGKPGYGYLRGGVAHPSTPTLPFQPPAAREERRGGADADFARQPARQRAPS